MDIGFIYVMQNPSMPGIYKIGYTMRSPHARAQELSVSTGVPQPFDIVMYWETEEPRVAESDIHGFLAEFRVSEGREFFRCDLDIIIDTFRMHACPFSEYENRDYIRAGIAVHQQTVREV